MEEGVLISYIIFRIVKHFYNYGFVDLSIYRFNADSSFNRFSDVSIYII